MTQIIGTAVTLPPELARGADGHGNCLDDTEDGGGGTGDVSGLTGGQRDYRRQTAAEPLNDPECD